MTIQSMWLLRKLKKAQLHPDNLIYIDTEELTATTIHAAGKPYEVVKLSCYKHSLESTLQYLKSKEYIEFDVLTPSRVTHTGWHAMGATVQGAVNFAIRDVIVPIVVTIVTTILLNHLM